MKGEGPRKVQIENLKKGTTFTVVTENGEKAHKTTDADMKVIAESKNANKLAAGPAKADSNWKPVLPVGGKTDVVKTTAEQLASRCPATPEELAAMNAARVSPDSSSTSLSVAKAPFPKWAVAGFAVAGALIGAGVAIAVLGLVWPVAVAAVAAAILVGGGRALYAKVTEDKAPIGSTVEQTATSTAGTPPPKKAADDVVAPNLGTGPSAGVSTTAASTAEEEVTKGRKSSL